MLDDETKRLIRRIFRAMTRREWPEHLPRIHALAAYCREGEGEPCLKTTSIRASPSWGERRRFRQAPTTSCSSAVPNPQAGTAYVIHFTVPEFTSLCPVTGQPDFAHLVIEHIPDGWLVESKSLKLKLPLFRPRRVPRGLHRVDRQSGLQSFWSRNGCSQAANGPRAGHSDRRGATDSSASACLDARRRMTARSARSGAGLLGSCHTAAMQGQELRLTQRFRILHRVLPR